MRNIETDWDDLSDEQRDALFMLYVSDRSSDVGGDYVLSTSGISIDDLQQLIDAGYVIAKGNSPHNGEMRYTLNERIAAFIKVKIEED